MFLFHVKVRHSAKITSSALDRKAFRRSDSDISIPSPKEWYIIVQIVKLSIMFLAGTAKPPFSDEHRPQSAVVKVASGRKKKVSGECSVG